MKLLLLISPEARGAYFADVLTVAQAELAMCTALESEHIQLGGMDFLEIEWPEEANTHALARLSFVQGIFQNEDGALRVADCDPDWALPLEMIFGAKFKGKTNERLTQLLMNIGLAVSGKVPEMCTLLDPMAGRGTTLLWAMAYGMRSYGLDLDPAATPDLQRNATKWAKLLRLKHKVETGFAAKKNKKGQGAFFEMKATSTSLRLTQGDAVNVGNIYRNAKFDLIVSDLPYGVQHMSGPSRSPLEKLTKMASDYHRILAKDGVVVLAFNRNNPKRKALEDAFLGEGWTVQNSQFVHRMSESIMRDVLIATRN